MHEFVPEEPLDLKDVEALYDELSGNYVLLWMRYVDDGVVLVRVPAMASGEMLIERKSMTYSIDIKGSFSIANQHNFSIDDEDDIMRFSEMGVVTKAIKYQWDGRRLLVSYGAALLRDVLWLKLD